MFGVLSEGGHEPVVAKDVAEESEEAAPPYPLMVRGDAPQRAQEVRERQGHRYCRPHAAEGRGGKIGRVVTGNGGRAVQGLRIGWGVHGLSSNRTEPNTSRRK